MGSLSARNRALVVLAFLVSAGLFATAAVALVRTGREDATPSGTLPSTNPTVVFPTDQPSESPTPAATVAPTATATATPTPSAAPTPAATASATPKATTSPRPRRTFQSPAPAGLYLDASMNATGGDTYAQQTEFVITARAIDGDGFIELVSLNWGDGTVVTDDTGEQCPAQDGGDCKDWQYSHTYAQPGTYTVTFKVRSTPETEVSQVSFSVKVTHPAPSSP